MQDFQTFMTSVTDKEGFLIVKEYEAYRKTGMIGDSTLRTKGEDFIRQFGVQGYGITRAMEDIHNSITKRFADRYIQDMVMLNEHTNNGRS